VGRLTASSGAPYYLDTNCFIYYVEQVAPYMTVIDQLWDEVHAQQVRVITSEFTLLEALVKPFKEHNSSLETAFRAILQTSPDVALIPITLPILERAARLRTTSGLKTPDAIHAATALDVGAAQFLTNDAGFRRVANLPVTLLDDLMAP